MKVYKIRLMSCLKNYLTLLTMTTLWEKDSLMLSSGTVEEDTPGSIYVMFEPFLTPSLFYKAVVDIAPSEWTGGIGKNGVLENGSIVFDIRNDTPAEILAKIFWTYLGRY